MNAGLYIVGTPIGNLGDVTLRSIEVLRAASLVLTEDTRRTGILLQKYEIRTPMLSCHKFNEASRAQMVAARIQRGEAIALATDSGMPAVSDPGSRIVTACREQGLTVTVVPGPSAVTAAVAASGFGGAGFVFEGFLEHKDGPRRRRLAELAPARTPVVLFESAHRLVKLLGEIREAMGDRRVFVAREMTKRFEEFLWGSPAELLDTLQTRKLKGEIVVVVAPASARPRDDGAQIRGN